jgi:hypothetical protein
MYFQKRIKKNTTIKKERKKFREKNKEERIKRDNFWRIFKNKEKMCS